MWGSKKKKEVVVLGYLGELNEMQTEVWGKFKAHVAEKGYDANPWFTDGYIVRFCRNNVWDLEKSIEQIDAHVASRIAMKTDTIIQWWNWD